MKFSRFITLITLILIALHVLVPAAAAHPLGNFTINHYAGLHLKQDGIEVDFVLDMAEIPAFQEIAIFDTNANGRPDPSETAGYHPTKCEALQPDLLLQLEGHPLKLDLVASAVEFPAGAGGLPTLRLSCTFHTSLPTMVEKAHFEFNNNVYAERSGWREIVITGHAFTLPATLTGMSHSLSQRLSVYPDDLLNSPPNQRQISFTLAPVKASPQQAVQASGAGQPLDLALPGRNDGFTQLITIPELTLPTVLLALGIAFVWGAGHALTPGHGKTIVAAYLVGSRGTIRHALFLGLTTTVTHTAGVFILGFLTLFASKFFLPEQLYPWLGVISGILVVSIGLSLFRGQLQGLAGHASHHHSHDHLHDHTHFYDHSHDHYHLHHHHSGHSHSHLPPDANGGPITWRSLLALGISGGLLPCPSALIVMLSAISLQRIGFGLVLVVAFSLGLAGVLTAIGIVWVQARQLFERLPKKDLFKPVAGYGRLLRVLPAASALFITVAGIGIAFQALIQTGILS
jgi:ABC-type nickel/cobalt efflux system permease component RcnA